MTQLEYKTCLSGVRMPSILYGTAWKKARTAELVAKALRAGFRGFDTACQPRHYDEAGVGAGLLSGMGDEKLSRADIYLQTKFTTLSGQDASNVPYDRDATLTTQVEQSFKASLANLRTDYLDSLILHSPITKTAEMIEVWQAMEALVDSGGVKQLGISNCYNLKYLETLHHWARIKPAVVQNRFYAETRYDRGIRAFCRQHGLVYQSFWTLTANPQLLASTRVLSVARLHARTPAEVLFRYLTQEGYVPLTGTQSDQHMQEDLSIFDFELSADERASITSLL